MPKIYLDANVWSRAFDRPSKRIIKETAAFFEILNRAFREKLAIVGSVALDVEVGRIENPEKRTVTERLVAIFTTEHVRVVPYSKAKGIKEAAGLKLPDAAHLACASEAGCRYFITCDDEIIRKKRKIEKQCGLIIYNPIEFINIGE